MEKLPEFIGNHLFLVSLFVAILSLLLWNLFGSAVSGVRQIASAELTRLMNHEKSLVVDVRPSADYEAGHILNAINIPENELSQDQKKLEKYKQQTVVAYCNTGAVATRSARTLKSMGYENVYCLSGGLQAWQSANLPVTKQT